VTKKYNIYKREKEKKYSYHRHSCDLHELVQFYVIDMNERFNKFSI